MTGDVSIDDLNKDALERLKHRYKCAFIGLVLSVLVVGLFESLPFHVPEEVEEVSLGLVLIYIIFFCRYRK